MSSNTGLLYLAEDPIKFPPVTRNTPVFYDETNQEIFALEGNIVSVFSAVSQDYFNYYNITRLRKLGGQ